jgi:hypothetical protein
VRSFVIPTGAQRSGATVSFYPCDRTAPNKSHQPLLVVPTRISCHVALDSAACAPFRKERPMRCINVTNPNSNPKAAEGSAVRSGSRTKISVSLVRQQDVLRYALDGLRGGLTSFLRRQRRLVAPFKPSVGLSGIPRHSTLLFVPTEAEDLRLQPSAHRPHREFGFSTSTTEDPSSALPRYFLSKLVAFVAKLRDRFLRQPARSARHGKRKVMLVVRVHPIAATYRRQQILSSSKQRTR